MPVERGSSKLGREYFSLGSWFVEPSLNRISNGDVTTQLELKVMDVLVCLAEQAGEVVSRQEIIDRVWATEFISDNTLTHAVTELRNALGDDARNPSFIETIHRRGYRLIAPVETAVRDEAAESKIARFPVPEGRAVPEDDRSPYPGLAAFTEADAEFFFGREAEVAQMWRKLTSRRLLAVIGPSGVGKSSFLRAGVIPAKPGGWGVVVCQPGESPFAALARALVPEFAGDDEAISKLVGLREPEEMAVMVGRWREHHDETLLIVDQFEELFTLNPEEPQATFAELLRRVVDEADVHVLLSMRDDFLYHVHEHPALAPILDELTLLGAPAPGSLRLALVEPARKSGYAFESEDLPGKMISAVVGERGALPLLAFAVARLWDERDRERKLLTREAYEEIGGVGGALARHAEMTLKGIGDERLPIVREIFRNLVTAEGTRAVREWEELLSVFDASDVDRAGVKPAPTKETTLEKPTVGAGYTHARAAAEEVVRRLVDARLLTSFEEEAVEGGRDRRVEVVHETLLTSWPRLVRWRTQDADAAQLRDQLRQAAKTWDEHGRTDDTLWTGAAYREFASWRDRYPGGLTETEEAFSSAMTAHSRRRKRRRRVAVSAALVVAVVFAVVFGTLWRGSVLETRRAEAQKLLAIAEVQLDVDPTEALALATSSLDLADTIEARTFALRALWEGPPALILDLLQPDVSGTFPIPAFSPDGRWLALAGLANPYVLIYEEGQPKPIILSGHASSAVFPTEIGWTRDGLLVTGHWTEGRARVWSMPEARLVREIEFGGPADWQVGETHLFAPVVEKEPGDSGTRYRLRSWRLPDGLAEELGEIDWGAKNFSESLFTFAFDPRGTAWIYARDNGIYSRPLPVQKGARDNLLIRHSGNHPWIRSWPRSGGLYSNDDGGEIVSWTTADVTSAPGRALHRPETATARLQPNVNGRWAIECDFLKRKGMALLWNLGGMPGAKPAELRRSGTWYFTFADFHPDDDWVVVSKGTEAVFWTLRWPLPAVVNGYDTFSRRPVAFTADGQSLVTNWGQDRVRIWSLPGGERPEAADLMFPRAVRTRTGVAVDPTGNYVLSAGYGGEIFLLSLRGGEARRLEGFPENDYVTQAAFSPSGQLVAAASAISDEQPTLRVWDVETGGASVFDLPVKPKSVANSAHRGDWHVTSIAFVDESTLYTGGTDGLLRWDLELGSFQKIIDPEPGGSVVVEVIGDRSRLLSTTISASGTQGPSEIRNLEDGTKRLLAIPRNSGRTAVRAINESGRIWVTGEGDGLLRVGAIEASGEHLLAGHKGPVPWVAISPDNRWIASSGEDETLRLWPMPDLSKPPLHTLPREELIAKLKSLTNLRAVRDEESSTGWKIEVGPFPGWKTVPTW